VELAAIELLRDVVAEVDVVALIVLVADVVRDSAETLGLDEVVADRVELDEMVDDRLELELLDIDNDGEVESTEPAPTATNEMFVDCNHDAVRGSVSPTV
jgi:hypothetical protein